MLLFDRRLCIHTILEGSRPQSYLLVEVSTRRQQLINGGLVRQYYHPLTLIAYYHSIRRILMHKHGRLRL